MCGSHPNQVRDMGKNNLITETGSTCEGREEVIE